MIAETAAHPDLSERRIFELQAKNVILRAGRGEIDLDLARISYIRHLRDNASGRQTPGELDATQELTRKNRALAIATELKTTSPSGGPCWSMTPRRR